MDPAGPDLAADPSCPPADQHLHPTWCHLPTDLEALGPLIEIINKDTRENSRIKLIKILDMSVRADTPQPLKATHANLLLH